MRFAADSNFYGHIVALSATVIRVESVPFFRAGDRVTLDIAFDPCPYRPFVASGTVTRAAGRDIAIELDAISDELAAYVRSELLEAASREVLPIAIHRERRPRQH